MFSKNLIRSVTVMAILTVAACDSDTNSQVALILLTQRRQLGPMCPQLFKTGEQLAFVVRLAIS